MRWLKTDMFEVKTGVFRGSGIRVVFLRHKVFVECINEKGQGKLWFFTLPVSKVGGYIGGS